MNGCIHLRTRSNNSVVEMRRDLGNPHPKVDLDVLLGMIVPNYQRAL